MRRLIRLVAAAPGARDRHPVARLAVVAVMMLAATTAGCEDEVRSATITVDHESTLADQPVRIQVSGLPANQRALVEATATDYEGRAWRGHATFTADGDGVVDLDSAEPADGSYADLYLPPTGGVPRTPVLIFGGSEGGSSQKFAAALLAQHYPELFRGVVLYAPSDRVGPGFPDASKPAWTTDGTMVPTGPIPVDRVNGPVLAIAGGVDALWPALPQAQAIETRMRDTNPKATVELLGYPTAGHGVGTFPFQPTKTAGIHRVSGHAFDNGGTRAADAEARRDGWPKVLAFLAALSDR